MRQAKQPRGRPFSNVPMAMGGLARLAARKLGGAGIDPVPLLRSAGIPPAIRSDPDLRVGVKAQTVFLDLAAEALGDALLGFHLACEFDLRELGLIYYVMASSRTLLEAHLHNDRYIGMVNEGVHVATRLEDRLIVDFEHVGIERRQDRHQMEFWLACHVKACRELTGREIVPIHVGLVHRRSGDVPEMERFFGHEVAFGAAEDCLAFETEVAALPIVSADPYLNRYLVRILEEAAARRGPIRDPLRVRVENAITPRLPHGTARSDAVAADLGMSPRTLSRRLAAEGTSFGAILDELRATLARRYLQQPELSISQVAWLVGYAEGSAFVRAVQRWTGKSPRELRQELTRTSDGE